MPIVSALIKVQPSNVDNIPILLKVNEAPDTPDSPITLLSEYQIREYGLVIDSVAKKHLSSHGQYGTQHFQVNPWVHMNFEDRGGLMGFEILPLEPGDEERYDIITITSPETWTPFRFQGKTMALHTTYQKCTKSFDPSDSLLEMGELPAVEAPMQDEDVFHDCLPVDNPHFIMHQLTYDEITGKHKVNPHIFLVTSMKT